MSRLIRTGNLIKIPATFYLAIALAGSGQANTRPEMDSQMARSDMTLWQTIDAVVQQIPFTRIKMERLLVTQLAEKDTSRVAIPNTAFQFYVGGPVQLAGDVVISNVDLRIRHRAGHPGFLVLRLNGDCIDLDTVRQYYSSLKVTDRPRGISPEEATSYTAVLHWGKLSFSFRQRNPNCLSSIAFAPALNEADDAAKR